MSDAEIFYKMHGLSVLIVASKSQTSWRPVSRLLNWHEGQPAQIVAGDALAKKSRKNVVENSKENPNTARNAQLLVQREKQRNGKRTEIEIIPPRHQDFFAVLQTSTKFSNISFPNSESFTSGWNCNPKRVPSLFSIPCTLHESDDAVMKNPSGTT